MRTVEVEKKKLKVFGTPGEGAIFMPVFYCTLAGESRIETICHRSREVEEEKLGREGKTGVESSCRGGSVAATGAAHLTLMLTPRSFLYPSHSAS